MQCMESKVFGKGGIKNYCTTAPAPSVCMKVGTQWVNQWLTQYTHPILFGVLGSTNPIG
jgi:hypothetical protein